MHDILPGYRGTSRFETLGVRPFTSPLFPLPHARLNVRIAPCLSLPPPYLPDKLRDYLEQVAHDPIVGDTEDRGIWIFVYGNDHVRAFHPYLVLYGA